MNKVDEEGKYESHLPDNYDEEEMEEEDPDFVPYGDEYDDKVG